MEPRGEDRDGLARFEEGIMGDLDEAEALIERALLAGAAEAEVYVKTSATTGIFLNRGFATLTEGLERGLALRVFDGLGNFGHAFSSRAAGSEGRKMIRAALAALREVREGPAGSTFPAPRPEGSFPRPEGIADPNVLLWSPRRKRAMVEEALGLIGRDHPEEAGATYRDGVSRVALANSRGLRSGYARTLSLTVLTRAGGDSPPLGMEHLSTGPDPAGILELSRIGARLRPEGGDEPAEWDVLLLEAAAPVSLVRHLLPDLVEDPAAVRDPAGADFRRLASDAVTMVDDGLLAGGVASAPFDGEGNPTGRITLVKAGIRIDRFRALRPGDSGRPGSAGRASYRDLPRPGGTNLLVVPGTRSLGELQESLAEGFLLADLEWDLRTPSGPSGSRFRGLGWKVRDGKCVGACRRLIFRGEPEELLEGIREVSSRPLFSLRRGTALGVPGLLIRRR
jgi:PmbA protein